MRYARSDEPLGNDVPPGTVHLRVVRDLLELGLFDRDGAPLAATSVDVATPDGSWTRRVETDAEGGLRVSLPGPRPAELVLCWGPEGARRTKRYYLALEDHGSVGGQDQRINNLFFAHPGLRKRFEEQLAAQENSPVAGLEASRDAIRRLLALLDDAAAP